MKGELDACGLLYRSTSEFATFENSTSMRTNYFDPVIGKKCIERSVIDALCESPTPARNVTDSTSTCISTSVNNIHKDTDMLTESLSDTQKLNDKYCKNELGEINKSFEAEGTSASNIEVNGTGYSSDVPCRGNVDMEEEDRISFQADINSEQSTQNAAADPHGDNESIIKSDHTKDIIRNELGINIENVKEEQKIHATECCITDDVGEEIHRTWMPAVEKDYPVVIDEHKHNIEMKYINMSFSGDVLRRSENHENYTGFSKILEDTLSDETKDFLHPRLRGSTKKQSNGMHNTDHATSSSPTAKVANASDALDCESSILSAHGTTSVKEPQAADPFAITAAPVPSVNNVALDVESKALVGGGSEKKATIVDVEKSKKDAKKNRGSAVRQVIAAFIANLGTINTGLVFGFAAVANPQLTDPSSSISVNEEQASWIASLSSVTTPIGCILSGFLMDSFGRKLTLIVTEIPAILGLLLISVSTDINMIYVGRLLVGLGSGMVGAPARVYTSEVTQPHLRGMLSALASVGVSLGVLIEYFLGSVMSWYLMAGISAIIPIMAFILIIFMPETPNWLLQRGRTEQARESLKKLRGAKCDVDKEIDDMICFAAKNNVVRLRGAREIISALMKPSTLKPFGILALYFLIYQFSGVNAITFYAVEVFKMSGTQMNKNLATVILGVVRLISTVIACICLRRCGRRPLTMISAIGCGLTMVGLGTYLFLREGWEAANIEPTATWFPVAMIFVFTIASTIGFLVVPWVMIGEVYPTQVRGIAGGITTFSAHLFIFAVVKTFPEFKHWLGIPGTFWMYGCISLVGSIFFHFCLPETKGRTLQEIEDYFNGRVKKLGEKNPSTANMPKVLDVPKGQILP